MIKIAVTDILNAMKGHIVLDCAEAFSRGDIVQAGLTSLILNRHEEVTG